MIMLTFLLLFSSRLILVCLNQLLVVQFHYQVHNGRLPSFAAKISGAMFQELLAKSMRGYFPDVGSRVFSLAKSGMSLQDAMNTARSEI
jgi:hypothetical protein